MENYCLKSKKPAKYWDNLENVLCFLKEIEKNLELKSANDWNKIKKKHIYSFGGSKLFQKYSMYDLKCLAYPDGKLLYNTPVRYWDDKNNILHLIDKVKENYQLKTPEDWHMVTKNQIYSCGGRGLFNKYSLFHFKCLACNDYTLNYHDNSKKYSSKYWDKLENILQFLDMVKQTFNLNSFEDWNSLTKKQIQLLGGNPLFDKYSLYELKCFGCPEGKAFFTQSNTPSSFWEKEDNIRSFINELKTKYNIKTIEDWKRLSQYQIQAAGGWGLIDKYLRNNKLLDEIKLKFPEISYLSFNSNKFIGRSSQRWLFLQIQKLFPGEEIIEDHFHDEISRKTGYSVQFDIFIVKKNIAIEYHGIQHYEDLPSAFSTLETYQRRDKEKERLCKEFGIQLIVIPYWWDNKIDSLKETLMCKTNITLL